MYVNLNQLRAFYTAARNRSMAAAAALFAGVHWAMNGSVKQVVIAFAFRLAALLVRQIIRRDNAFYICAGMHFFYNLMVFFVISI